MLRTNHRCPLGTAALRQQPAAAARTRLERAGLPTVSRGGWASLELVTLGCFARLQHLL